MLKPAGPSPQVISQGTSPEVYPEKSYQSFSAAWSLLAKEVWNEQPIIGHVNIGIIFSWIGNPNWSLYNTQFNSDLLFNTE